MRHGIVVTKRITGLLRGGCVIGVSTRVRRGSRGVSSAGRGSGGGISVPLVELRVSRLRRHGRGVNLLPS